MEATGENVIIQFMPMTFYKVSKNGTNLKFSFNKRGVIPFEKHKYLPGICLIHES